MVLPKIGASYVLKKITDEVMAEPKAAVEAAMTGMPQPGQQAGQASQTPQQVQRPPEPEPDEFDGQPVSDENGEVIGTARRMREIAVYLSSDSYGDLHKELEACLLDEESRRYLIHDDRGHLTGIIYAPHPDRMPARAEAIRADDI
jgi:hypothetical protein